MPNQSISKISPQVHREMGLNDSEFAAITTTLGREPTLIELGMYAVMWSEHCGYKYSRPVLRLFSKYREAMDTGSVENAGVVNIGDNIGIVMKMESHNHPSSVEPFQGAATGVGGILRDIFTMGARPIASLNSLRFGHLTDPRTRYLFQGVVRGIAHYGNCVGVPTIGGETYFHPSFSGNPLVNALAVGIVDINSIASAGAFGLGNSVLYVGSATGRDGIHGATFASVELGPDSESKRPNVQMGDPFAEKLLIEATLEALATGHIVGIQDMGAAGLTCATSETAAKAGTGITMDIRRVPQRESGMNAYEVMLSESQERMLAIVQKGFENEVSSIFHRWGLNAVIVGKVTDSGRVVIMDGDRVEASIPARSLTDDCPTYTLPNVEPDYIQKLRSVDLSNIESMQSNENILLSLLKSPSISSKRWVYEQYDSMVQTQTVTIAGGSDAALLQLRDAKGKGLALTVDCNSRYCYLDPYLGAKLAVAEAARNLCCVGAVPLAVTDCLNFANPEKPDNFWQFKRAVEGIAEACNSFAAPVISGNVSFYNETPEQAIQPTPTIGMLGLLDNVNHAIGSAFVNEGDLILLVGSFSPGFGGSEYLSVIHNLEVGSPPTLNIDAELAVQQLLRSAIASGLVKSAHDISDGGLAVCIAESCMGLGLGASVVIDHLPGASVALKLFGETCASILITISALDRNVLIELCEQFSVSLFSLGHVVGSSLTISSEGKSCLSIDVIELAKEYENAIPALMGLNRIND